MKSVIRAATLVLLTAISTLIAPILLLGSAVIDLAHLQRRLPRTRVVAFGLCWLALESIGVLCAGLLWLTGRRGRQDVHFRLQRWWSHAMVRALEHTVGLRVHVEGLEHVKGGAVLLARHVSLLDALLTAELVSFRAGLNPRMVLKAELGLDPCLGIVGRRLPNVFVNRGAEDQSGNLEALRVLARDMNSSAVTIIFPEGTRANGEKRRRALERIAVGFPARAERLEALTCLLPIRPAGTCALLDGAPEAGVVWVLHRGLDGLDTFRGIVNAIARGPLLAGFWIEPSPRSEIPINLNERIDWLDDKWLGFDAVIGGRQ